MPPLLYELPIVLLMNVEWIAIQCYVPYVMHFVIVSSLMFHIAIKWFELLNFELWLNINEKGVAKLLKEIDPSKAGGPDEVPCRMLKELADDMAPILTDIYRQSLSTGVLLNIWKTGYVSPIFKRVAVWEAENYRPVSLTCIPCKILEHIICSHLRRHLDIQYIPRNMHTVLLCFALLWLRNRS